jgi:hypothetical protein
MPDELLDEKETATKNLLADSVILGIIAVEDAIGRTLIQYPTMTLREFTVVLKQHKEKIHKL